MASRSDSELLRESDLFDSEWYLSHYLDVRLSGLDPVEHYLTFGALQGRDPSTRFSTSAYLEQNPHVRGEGTNPLVHYLRLPPSEHPERRPRARKACRPAGWEEVSASNLFDAEWYLDHYPAVRKVGMDPAEHYLRIGALLGYDPGAGFSTARYLTRHASVRSANVNPLLHYLRYGQLEGREIQPSSLSTPPSTLRDYQLIRDSNLFDADWYVARHPSAGTSGTDPVEHYLSLGTRHSYDPSAHFSARTYLEKAPDVLARGLNPLLHYLKYGRDEGRAIVPANTMVRHALDSRTETIERHALFDAEWYLNRYPDVAQSEMSAADHYAKVGAELLRDPGPDFSTSAYATRHPDVIAAGGNPLEHLSDSGEQELRPLGSDTARCQRTPTPVHVPKASSRAAVEHSDARVVAFYLPQFHSIPENDTWWGEGFTEWTGVKPAAPEFPGHYQPHVPGELGYYDLRDSATQHAQVDLAKHYGIDAFCFYFYWFNGVTLLETPLQNWLADSSLDLSFMLCWANENWSRRWDGHDDDVLIAQEHSAEDDLAFIEHVAQYLRDPRYTRIDGKPVLVVYRASLLPEAAQTAARWRAWCRENGVGEIYIACTTSLDRIDPTTIGFDAAIEFAPNNMGAPDVTSSQPKYSGFDGRMFDWAELESRSHSYTTAPYPLFRCVNPSWDNTPRRGTRASVLVGSSPGKFVRWTINAIREARRTRTGGDDDLVFINAWNEWGEGAHLEPDRAYGYAWLESVRVALAATAPPELEAGDQRVATVVDLTVGAFPHVLPTSLTDAADAGTLWVVVGDTPVEMPVALKDRTHVVRAPHGIGLLGLLTALPDIVSAGLHIVRRIDTQADDSHSLLPNPTGADEARFADEVRLGLVRRGGTTLPSFLVSYAESLAARLGLERGEVEALSFEVGGSVVARISALAPIAAIALDGEDCLPTGARYVPYLHRVLDATLAASTVIAGMRVDGDALPAHATGSCILVVTPAFRSHTGASLALALGTGFRNRGFDVRYLALEGGDLQDQFSLVGETRVRGVGSGQVRQTRLELRTLFERGTRTAIVTSTAAAEFIPLLKAEGFFVTSLIHETPDFLRESALVREASYIAEFADSVVFPSARERVLFEEFVGRGPMPNAAITAVPEVTGAPDVATGHEAAADAPAGLDSLITDLLNFAGIGPFAVSRAPLASPSTDNELVTREDIRIT